MADILKKQIREAAAAAGVLGNLTTTGARVYQSRTHELQDANLPALRIYTNDEEISVASMGVNRLREHRLDLVVEACAKESADLDDKLDLIEKEVMIALDANQSLGVGVKYVEPRRVEMDLEGEAEKEVGIKRMTFEVLYYTAKGSPDVAV